MELKYKIFSLLIFAMFSLPCVLDDIRTMIINPWNSYFGTAVLILVSAFFYQKAFIPSVISCAGIFLLFLVTGFVFKADLGMGDVKYSLFCGMAVGNWLFTLAGLFVACVGTALTFGIAKIKGSPFKKLPFVPFLFVGMVLALGAQIVLGIAA